MGTILLVLLIFLLVGALPPFGLQSYGWGPPGLLTVVVVVLVVLLLTGRL